MSKIVLEDFNEGDGYYKVNLAYLNKEQVEEIEALVSKWNPTDEDIKACIGMCLTDANEQRFKDYGTNLKDCLAWLEKQKVIDTDLLRKEIEKRMRNCDVVFERDYETYDPDTYYQAKAAAYQEILSFIDSLQQEQQEVDGLEKQKEHKPAEWSDRVAKEMFIKALERAAEQTKKGYELTDCDKHSWWEDFKAYSGISPTKWSEEDEKMLNMIEYRLKDWDNIKTQQGYQDDYTLPSPINWLKSLRPQPKQKINNMITPNKEFFQWIYDRLVNVHKEDPNVDYMMSFKRRIEELSFDEPSWKPTKEQMKAIKHAYNSFPNDCATKSNLKLLYSDLKKLT